MATSRWTLSIVTAVLILLSAGCNSGSTANVTNPPPPPAQGITIAFQPTPPTTVLVGSTATFTAVVTNDSSNAGVDWSLTCQTEATNPGSCGALSALHTASGTAVTYTPPASLTGNSEVVNVAAFATADHTENVLSSLSVSAYGNNLSGTYVLAAQGMTGGEPFQLAGVVSLDGNGNVTSGQLTVDMPGQGVSSETDNVTSGSTYFLGPNGEGNLSLNISDTSISPLVFSLAYLSSAHLLIGTTANSNDVDLLLASGTMDQQASDLTPLSAGYAFVLGGTDIAGNGPVGYGGILNVDGANSISGTGSTLDQNLYNVQPTLTVGQQVTGTIISGSSGSFSLALTFPQGTLPNGVTAMALEGYFVDQNHIKLIESDQGGSGSVAGVALAQGTSTGTFTDASFSGTYVFGTVGFDMSGGSNYAPATLTAAAVLMPDGSGHFTSGFTDTVFEFLSNPSPQLQGGPTQISTSFTGVYAVTPNGRIASTVGGAPNPNNLFRPVIVYYLGGDGTALVLMNTDANNNYPMVATGGAYPQAATPTFTGSYGLDLVQQLGSEGATNPDEYIGNGLMTVAPPSITGTAYTGDVTGTNNPSGFAATISTTACSSVVTGCFSGSFTSGFQGENINTPGIIFGADFYLIDSTQGFIVENDLLQQSSPQLSFGYYTVSTSVQPPSTAKAAKEDRKLTDKHTSTERR